MCGQKYRNIAKTIQNNKICAQQRSTTYSQLITIYSLFLHRETVEKIQKYTSIAWPEIL